MAREQEGRLPFESGESIKQPDPMNNGMNLNQATNRISEILRGGAAPEPEPVVAAKPKRKLRPAAEDETPDVVVEDDSEEEVDEGELRRQENEDEGSAEPEQDQKTKAQDEEEGDEEGVLDDAYELEPAALAEFLGVDEEDLILSDEGGLSLRTKVDGKVAEVGLRELRDSFQMAKASQARMQALAEERKDFDASRQQGLQQLNEQQQYMGAALNAIENAYATEFRSVDWQRLRTEDPEGYASHRQAFDERMIQVNQFKQAFAQQAEKLKKADEERREQRWSDGFRRLNDVFTGKEYTHSPKWDEKEKDRLANFMVQSGMSTDDLGKVDNWLVFKWARDAMLRSTEVESARKAVRRVVRLPKVSKPGTSKTGKQVRQANKRGEVDEARKKQRSKTQKVRDRHGKFVGYQGQSNLQETADLISKIMRS